MLCVSTVVNDIIVHARSVTTASSLCCRRYATTVYYWWHQCLVGEVNGKRQAKISRDIESRCESRWGVIGEHTHAAAAEVEGHRVFFFEILTLQHTGAPFLT